MGIPDLGRGSSLQDVIMEDNINDCYLIKKCQKSHTQLMFRLFIF